MRIFCTGASGYIGGSVAAAMVASGHEVSGLVRSERSAEQVRALGVAPVLGSLDDLDILRHAAGHRVDDVFDEATPLKASSGRAARIALNARILGFAERSVRSVIICPSLIYGLGTGPARHSIQVPWLIALARKAGVAKHYGPGENIWANVHIADLVDLYRLALDAAPAGAFYFAENGENSMKEICEAINRTLGVAGGTQEMSLEDAAREWGEGPTQNTMGSNSRVRAVRARTELGWSPSRPSLIYEIEQGCYAESLSSGAASAR